MSLRKSKNLYSRFEQTFIIKRDLTYSKHDFFNMLSNKLGFDIELSHNFIKSDNTVGFSKWLKWSYLHQYNPDEFIKEVNMTRNEFIEKATHRSILDIEIVFDIDDQGEHSSIKQHARFVCIHLNCLNLPFVCYSTGSKGFHIHTFYYPLRNMSRNNRMEYKKALMLELKTDSMKSGNRNMIAIEGEKHWKSGKLKQEVDFL